MENEFMKQIDKRKQDFIKAVHDGDMDTVQSIVEREHDILTDYLHRGFRKYVQQFKKNKRSIVHTVDPMVRDDLQPR